MKISTHDRLAPKQDAHQIPIVVSFSEDGWMAPQGAKLKPLRYWSPVQPRLRLGEADLGISQLWPVYQSSDEVDYSAFYKALQIELDERKKSMGCMNIMLIDFVPETESAADFVVNTELPSESIFLQLIKAHLDAKGFAYEFRNQKNPIFDLSRKANNQYAIQIGLSDKLLNDTRVINSNHQTHLQVVIREMMLLLSGVLIGKIAN